jgi:hypothetical protein
MPTKSLDAGIKARALKKLSRATEADFMDEFKKQGITSLNDLAKQAATVAKGGLAVDWEDFPYCYKFTMVRPHFDQDLVDRTLKQLFP